jgi:hypothetical protein
VTYLVGGGIAVAGGAAVLWLLNQVNEHRRAEARRQRGQQRDEVEWP